MLSGDSSQSVPPMSLISSQSDRFFYILHNFQFSQLPVFSRDVAGQRILSSLFILSWIEMKFFLIRNVNSKTVSVFVKYSPMGHIEKWQKCRAVRRELGKS